jgi:gliding motility-associated-like protein
MSVQRRNFIVSFLLMMLVSGLANATEPYCQNLGFELGNFTNWTGYSWIYRTDYPSYNTSKVLGILSGRQTIMTDTLATDSKTGGLLRKIPKGSRYSARLGDAVTGGRQESLSYTLTVDQSNALLIWRFAVVLQDPIRNHEKFEEPRFRVYLINEQGDTLRDCTNYDVYASDATINGFQTFNPTPQSTIYWRDWTAVGANLLPFIGQKITIEFMAADCTHQGHYGYAYFVAECHPMNIAVQFCAGDTKARLMAPEGFEIYTWKDSVGVVVGDGQSLEVANPKEGATYSCSMTSATRCSVTLSSTILRYEPNADFKYDLVDCNNLTNTMRFSNLYPTSNGTLTYDWNFKDGSHSTEKNPTHQFATSGLHPVTLLVRNPPSTCTDSVIKMVETFYPPLVGISGNPNYCPGKTTTLKGYGAYRYEWSTGSTTDSIQVGTDTKVWMIGYSSVGCYTDTIWFSVKLYPDWDFSLTGDPLFCQNESTTLTAAGAKSYRWNSGEKTSSITIKTPGFYSVTGTDILGCSKTISLNVVEDPLPNVNFTLSESTVDSRHNKLRCILANQPGVQYSWEMGDGNIETGNTITHAYDVANNLYEYNIYLTATNANGCVNTATKTVDIVPFIPNVFSPNGDGVNDVFVAGLEMQIQDRYGLKIYDGKTGWDGTYKGKKVDNDTYFYFIYYVDKHQQTQTLKGYVTLKR